MTREFNEQELETMRTGYNQDRRNCSGDLEAALTDLSVLPTSLNIAIQFECGECCKKVFYGESIAVIGCFIVLRPAAGRRLKVKLFCGGRVADVQWTQVIIIPIDKISSIEIGAEECN